MAAIFAYQCSKCDEIHEGSPSFAFDAPAPYRRLSEQEREAWAELSDELCVISHPEGTQYYVRAILEVPIHGLDEPFLWGIWVSASEASFHRYLDSFDKPPEDPIFFGWLSNLIAVYPTQKSRPADVHIQADGTRPRVVLHRGDNEIDALVIDQHEGISIARAQQLAEQSLHGI
ncbi:hypothetical protein O987_08535 [Comamonas testosteroni TK102]|jgi:hypothetical protein|uniref:DUF2199 domain-containing protein n=1 Tax=Comamonas testosteroni TK102 TaxID=1392005 RepID=A0A076PJQ2_COMTE|nr:MULTISPECIES: DUF2199 domain-containing protein [Comamonas]AIJ45853.1 hypothetical protein O987_08535 [Comamonas testosteroni TK102]MPS87152.1 DUF2199 domain-containing protein [Comamonas sp.]